MPALLLSTALAILLTSAPPEPPGAYKGSPAELAARADGRRVVAELSVDLDTDGSAERAVVEASRDGKMRVLVLRAFGDRDEPRYEQVATTAPRPASKLVRFEARQVLASPSPELVAVFEDSLPDERAQHVRIIARTAQGIVPVFEHTFYLPREEAVDSRVALGDATPRFSLAELDGADEGGDQEVVFVGEPQVLTLEGREGPVPVVIGAYRDVWRLDERAGAYVQVAARSHQDFAESKVAWTVEASAQVPKIWGTAQAFWATDGLLETAWSVAGGDGGKDEWLRIGLRREQPVRVVRVVPGCARSEADWDVHGRVRSFRLELSSGLKLDVDRHALTNLGSGLLAAGEFPLEGGFGVQTLLLLADPQTVGWARLTVLEAEGRGGVDEGRRPKGAKAAPLPPDLETCVAELTLY